MKKLLFAALVGFAIAAHAASPAGDDPAPHDYKVQVYMDYPDLNDPRQAANTRRVVLATFRMRGSDTSLFLVLVHTKADADRINGWIGAAAFRPDGAAGARVMKPGPLWSNQLQIYTEGVSVNSRNGS
jgi:hypothetical protein